MNQIIKDKWSCKFNSTRSKKLEKTGYLVQVIQLLSAEWG